MRTPDFRPNLAAGRRRDGLARSLSFANADLLDALARAASENLAAGDIDAAFAFADRRCRLIVPSARDLLLRAQAHKAAGRREAAQRDLSAALALDPTDILVDRAALAWGDGEGQIEAARRITEGVKADWALRRRALAVLLAAGETLVWRLRRSGAQVSGWLAWAGGEPLRLTLPTGETFIVEADPDHPLSDAGLAAADVAIETIPAGPLVLTLVLSGGEVARVTPKDAARPTRRPVVAAPARTPGAGPLFVTVIVPVYEDFEATRACLAALQRAPPACAHRVIVIDDASPNAQLRAWLDIQAAAGAFELLRNDVNLGFAASVNRALARRERGDVLLLNADALTPPGAVDRLAALSRASPDLGTLTPFSNNGELTSWPKRNRVNPMPSAEEIATLDALARAANGDALIDIPNGIGFCLYVTQACLEAVGELPELYAQGYFEDVEFGLAARERGLRNVAAAGVYVGHAGSRSFGLRKRALVARNLQIVEARFPGYRLETAAFVARDPLRPFRAALDAAAPPRGPAALVVGGASAAAIARRRAEGLGEEAAVLMATAAGSAVALSAVGDAPPQSLSFDFAAGEGAAFVDYLARLDVRRVEWLDPDSLPEAALAALLDLPARNDLVCGDLVGFLPVPVRPNPCPAPADALCGPCGLALAAPAQTPARLNRRPRLGRVVERVERILPLDRMAESFALRTFKAPVVSFGVPAPPPPEPRPIRRLGALYPRRCVAAERVLLALARRLAAQDAAAELIVLGATLDDEALMATGKAFVVGPVAHRDYAAQALNYRLDALLGPERGAGFGDLEATAAAAGLAKAYFDASFGGVLPAPGDLSLDPRICDVKAATACLGWIAGSF